MIRRGIHPGSSEGVTALLEKFSAPPPRLPKLKIPAEVSRPKGSSKFFEKALKRLTPYTGTWTSSKGRKYSLSEQWARREIESVARVYNTNRYFEDNAPRSPAIFKKLQKLKVCVAKLQKELEGIDYLTSRVIVGEASISSQQHEGSEFDFSEMRGFLVDDSGSSAWCERVTRLNACLAVMVKDIPCRWAGAGRDIRDKGAKRNHFIETAGTAKQQLLRDTLHIYRTFKPGQDSGTEGSDLHQFIDEIIEYATGKQPSEGIIRPLRDLLTATREEDRLGARIDELFETLDRYKEIASLSKQEKRARTLHEKELLRCFMKLRELTWITWPHTRPPAE